MSNIILVYINRNFRTAPRYCQCSFFVFGSFWVCNVSCTSFSFNCIDGLFWMFSRLIFFLLYTSLSEFNCKTNVPFIILELNNVCQIATRNTSHKLFRGSLEGHSSVTAFKVVVIYSFDCCDHFTEHNCLSTV